MQTTELMIFIKVVIAMLAGGCVGFEREMHKKPAGLRTHMLTAGAATLLVSLGNVAINTFAAATSAQLNIDPLRIFEAIVVGISFVGAGTIIKSEEKSQAKNLSTAASVLITAIIGIAIALEKYTLGIGVVILVIFVNWVIGAWEDRFFRT